MGPAPCRAILLWREMSALGIERFIYIWSIPPMVAILQFPEDFILRYEERMMRNKT
jgi:hypothetical protein